MAATITGALTTSSTSVAYTGTITDAPTEAQFDVVVGNEIMRVLGPSPIASPLTVIRTDPNPVAHIIGEAIAYVDHDAGLRGELVGDVKLTPAGLAVTKGFADVATATDVPTVVRGDVNATGMVDYVGDPAIDEFGFSRSQVDFIVSRLYNHTLGTGKTTNMTGTTIVSGADSVADYQASLSQDISYWIIGTESGGGSLQRVADANADGGFALRWQNIEDATIFQDAPAYPGRHYSVRRRYRDGTGVTQTVTVSFRDVNHAIIGSAEVLSTGAVAGSTPYTEVPVNPSSLSPIGTRYIRVELGYVTSAGTQVYLSSVFLEESALGRTVIHDDGELTLISSGAAISTGSNEADVNDLDFKLFPSGQLEWQTTGAQLDDVTDAGRLQMTTAGLTLTGNLKINATGLGLTMPGGGYLEMTERAAPSAPGTNDARLYVRDNGSGKTQLVILFNTGSVIVLATQV